MRNAGYFVLDRSLRESKCDIRNWLYAQRRRKCMIYETSELRILGFQEACPFRLKTFDGKMLFES